MPEHPITDADLAAWEAAHALPILAFGEVANIALPRLIARVRELEAEVAAFREVVMSLDAAPDCQCDACQRKPWRAALSGTAGAALLARLEAAEKVVAIVERIVADDLSRLSDQPSESERREAIEALAAWRAAKGDKPPTCADVEGCFDCNCDDDEEHIDTDPDE